MRVLIWTQYFWPENFHINAVARSLHQQGVDVTVLTGKPNYPEGAIYPGYCAAGIQREEYSGIEIIRVPLRPRGKNSGLGLALNYLSFIVSGYLFAPIALRGRRFDVVFVYAPSPLLQALPAIYLSWLKRAPLVLWVQDVWPDVLVSTGFVKSRWILGAVGCVVRYIYRASNLIWIQSEAFRGSVERWARKKEGIHFCPNSAEDPLDVANISRTPGLESAIAESFSVVFAGNIGTAQSCETIVAAAKRLAHVSGIRFFLIGDGSMAEAIRQRVEKDQLANVIMTGRVPADAMAAIYSVSSVLLLTLRADPALSSTIPSKLQSYFAAGKPVVACSNGEAARIVDIAKAGAVCPAGDGEALAATVLKLYELSPEQRQLLGNNGRAYFDAHFRLHRRVGEMVSHFKQLLTPRA